MAKYNWKALLATTTPWSVETDNAASFVHQLKVRAIAAGHTIGWRVEPVDHVAGTAIITFELNPTPDGIAWPKRCPAYRTATAQAVEVDGEGRAVAVA